jgi:tRNA pseudouridine32 synthase/23S rRNA pseudouridine746 synthase
MRDGVGPSCVVLPSRGQGSLLDFLAERLPAVPRDAWRERMEEGDVLDACGARASV